MRSLRRASHSSAPPPARPPETAQPLPLPGERQRGGTLTPQQVAFFETFGFLRLPGLFADDIDRITRGFEEIFENHHSWEADELRQMASAPDGEDLHFGETRMIIPGFVERSPLVADLPRDPRVLGVVTSLMGTSFEYAESDGNLFYCETSWHPDTYAAPIQRYHVKLSFYLDPLTADSGAIRMMPGTNHYQSTYARTVYRDLEDPDVIRNRFGVDFHDIPSCAVESTPGDVIALNFRTMHASFHGRPGRRLFTLNFRGVAP